MCSEEKGFSERAPCDLERGRGCPKCGAVYQVAGLKAREVFRGAAKPVPETEVENSEVELVSLSEVEEREDKVAGVDDDDLEVEAEPADNARLPEEEEELTGDI